MENKVEINEKVITNFLNCHHSDDILLRLNELRNDSQLCDIILVAGDEKFNAHRNVLSAASLYFLAMFSGYFPESDKKEIVLNDMEPDCLKLILDYIYTGHLVVNHANVQNLLATASFLQIDWIEERCCDFIVKALDANNCLGVKKFGENHSLPRLEEYASEYVLKHFQEVTRSDEFLSIPFDEFHKILENPELYIYDEEALLRSIIKWIDHNPAERQQHLTQLVTKLHPACVSNKLVQSINMLHDDKDCRDWVDSVSQSIDKMQWNIFVLDKMGRQPDFGKYDMTTGNMIPLSPFPLEAFALSFASQKHFLYVQGGCVGRSRRTCFYYNVYKNKWFSMPSMKEQRSHHRSLILDSFLYAMGGNGSKVTHRSVECMDLETGTTMLVEPMLSPRSSMGAVVCEQSLYVMGGETDQKSLSSVEMFDPRVGIWQSMPRLNVVNSYCTSAVTDNYIYCCEGLGSSMERFDLRSREWEMIEFTSEREFFEIFSIGNDVYSISSEEIARYYPAGNRWENIFYYPFTREWDTALAVELVNESSVVF
ncbi:kelch-like protein 28 isoform X1 [Episyrphus balteatus]|uniref:kelch-like protein 28 isoform X1 n=2 Tax=Episyrphus balteatus TaxID=286459 RepID=UPI0024863625|nr:kelch-like protein 28 isoform X1 [Episyrphus balteatus]